MMTDSFVRRRILWRAAEHTLLQRRCVLWQDATQEQQVTVAAALGGLSDGILLFWESAARWTLLSETSVA